MKVTRQITTTKETEICDYGGCGKDLQGWINETHQFGNKVYCWEHYKEAKLKDHKEHRFVYNYSQFGDELFVKKCCANPYCDYKDQKTVFYKHSPREKLWEIIFENQDVLELIQEKAKENK